ncbi:MAG: ATP-binding cassette domain-containing protein [Gammaproteobacteria bacterium]|nr:ATP-binding cassette domain-containing protein [Gammaproteobacteria bacterium]
MHGNVDIRQVDTAFEVSGRILELAVEEGVQVTQNQILSTLKSQRYQQQLARIAAEMSAQKERLAALLAGTRTQEIDLLRARVDAARAEAENASQKVQRLQTLVRDNLASQDNLDDAQSARKVAQAKTRVAQKELDLGIAGPRNEDIATARAQLEALQAALALARIDLDDTTLFAPQAGMIRERLLQVGDMAGPQRPVFSLALTDLVWVRAYVREVDLGQTRPGVPATIHTDSGPSEGYAGWVGYVSPTAEFTPKNVQTEQLRTDLVYQVHIMACNPDGRLRLGMPASVTIVRGASPQPPASRLATAACLALRYQCQTMNDSALRIESLCKSFRVGKQRISALDGVTLSVQPGCITGLIGPDAAGKTTLMRLAAGLLLPDEGRIEVLGLDVQSQSLKVQATIGYMPQRFGLYEDLSVQQNLDLYADLQSIPKQQHAERYQRLTQMTGLENFTARLAGQLSGGMQQKLGLACALVRSQKLLLLDEPTVGVDPVSRRELWAIINELVEEEGTTVLISTAYLDEAARCHQVLLLHEGKLLDSGTPDDFRHPCRVDPIGPIPDSSASGS